MIMAYTGNGANDRETQVTGPRCLNIQTIVFLNYLNELNQT